jgi:hypothetical protein
METDLLYMGMVHWFTVVTLRLRFLRVATRPEAGLGPIADPLWPVTPLCIQLTLVASRQEPVLLCLNADLAEKKCQTNIFAFFHRSFRIKS